MQEHALAFGAEGGDGVGRVLEGKLEVRVTCRACGVDEPEAGVVFRGDVGVGGAHAAEADDGVIVVS
jgi:hypothetical protein